MCSTDAKMILIILAGGACGILSSVFTNLCAQNYGNDIRKDVHFFFDQMDDFTTGSLITRTTSDVTQVQNMAAQMICCCMFLIGGSWQNC